MTYKFQYINHSIPLSQRIKRFTSYEDMIKVIGIDRKMERIYIIDFYSFEYVPSEEVYKLYCKVAKEYNKETKEYNDISDDILECPAYSFAQFTRDILDVGDQCKMVSTLYDVDKKLDKLEDEDGNFIPSTQNLDKLREIFRSVWDIKRNKNTRTSPVICHRVWDFATTSKDGDGRCFVTTKYIWIRDIVVVDDVLEEAQGINPDIEYIKGHATALSTVASFGSRNPVMINDKPTLIGFTIINSEFKNSQLVICAYIYIPEYNIQLIARTVELKIELKHVGDPEVFSNMVRKGVKEVLGKGKIIADMFGRLTTCSNRASAIDYTALNEKDSNAVGVELKMSNKIKQLIQIKEIQGYSNYLDGLVHTLMDYATNHAETETDRMNTYKKVMDILRQPDVFVDTLGLKVNRAKVIKLRSVEKVEQQQIEDEKNGIVKYI
ncbi:hypothetical protein LCGC14_0795820 [marine sediment metagenome]|uniref:Uncharacterized protein n=1 Tax=marine sediment metagenome TaxID=412755 RepID=A0A0F9SYF5_9ZZZZ